MLFMAQHWMNPLYHLIHVGKHVETL